MSAYNPNFYFFVIKHLVPIALNLRDSTVYILMCLILFIACSNSAAAVSRMANHWNIPVMTYGGTDEVLSNNTEFPTLTRLSYTLNDFAKFYFAIFKVGGVTQL